GRGLRRRRPARDGGRVRARRAAQGRRGHRGELGGGALMRPRRGRPTGVWSEGARSLRDRVKTPGKAEPSRYCLKLGGLLLAACPTHAPRAQAPDGAPPVLHASAPITEGQVERPRPPSAPCPVEDRQDVDAALDEAARRFDKGDFLVALACAEQA